MAASGTPSKPFVEASVACLADFQREMRRFTNTS
jgi:hypothetical protein